MGDKLNTIVGIDPGTTSAISVFSLEGRLVFVGSIRNAGLERIVQEIEKHGKPVVIACDVSPAPGIVIEIARKFNSRLFVPQKSLSVEEKQELARGSKYENVHEMDALASSLKFFSMMGNKLRWLEKELDEFDEKKKNEIMGYVMGGIGLRESVMLASGKAKGIEEKKEVNVKEAQAFPKRDKEYEEKIRELAMQNLELRKYAERLEEENGNLKEKLAANERSAWQRMRLDREILKRDIRIKVLEGRLKEIYERRKRFKVERQEEKKKQEKETEKKRKDLELEKMIDEYREKSK